MANLKLIADEGLALAYKEYGKSLEKYCKVRLGEAADSTDDCVQEAFCVYYKRLLNGDKIDKPKAFLYRTADNMVKRVRSEHYKNASRTAPLDEAAHIEAQQVDELAAMLDYDKLKNVLLEGLRDSERQLYQLKYVEGKSLKEIGDILKIPPTTVANRTSRLRSKIKLLTSQLMENIQKGGS